MTPRASVATLVAILGVLALQVSSLREQARTREALDRLAQALAASPRATSGASATDLASAEDPNFRKAQALVDRAVAAGVWGDPQVAEFRNLRAGLTPAQLTSLMGRLIPAINAQAVRVETHGPPF